MLTTATEKVKLWRVTYRYFNLEYWEGKVKYFTSPDEAIKFVVAKREDTQHYEEVFADEVTALVTYNT